jgi:hypothetical protein
VTRAEWKKTAVIRFNCQLSIDAVAARPLSPGRLGYRARSKASRYRTAISIRFANPNRRSTLSIIRSRMSLLLMPPALAE